MISHGPDDIVGVHDGGRPNIDLTKQEVLIYRMDLQRMGRRVAAALGFEAVEAAVAHVPHTFRIGTFCPFAGFTFPVYLVVPLEAVDLLRAIEVVSSESGAPFIMMAPTTRRLRPACEVLLKNRKACFVALAQAITLDATGGWTCSPEVTQQLDAFRQMAIPQAENAGGIAFLATPAGATWADVRIKFADGETVAIKIGDVAGKFLFSEIGMVDGRSKKPNKQWELLRSFAKGNGVMTWKSPAADRKSQKRREYLARDLKAFFRIEGDPIILTDDRKGWRIVFSLEPDV